MVPEIHVSCLRPLGLTLCQNSFRVPKVLSSVTLQLSYVFITSYLIIMFISNLLVPRQPLFTYWLLCNHLTTVFSSSETTKRSLQHRREPSGKQRGRLVSSSLGRFTIICCFRDCGSHYWLDAEVEHSIFKLAFTLHYQQGTCIPRCA